MTKSSLNAFLTDSESLKSLLVLLATIYMTVTGIVSPEVGMAAMFGQSTGYGAIRQWGKNNRNTTEAMKAEAQADAAEAYARVKTGDPS